MWMNEYQVEDAVRDIDAEEFPNLARVARTVENLLRWTNRNSDGWAYWQKPSNAAKKATEVLQEHERVSRRGHWDEEPKDLTDAEVRRVFTPIKSFLTRHGVNHDLILEAVPA